MLKGKIDYRDIYYDAHPSTDESVRRDIEGKKWYLELHKLYPKESNARILDIGSANGATLQALRDAGYTNTLGIELFDELAEDSRKRGGVNVICSDAISFFRDSAERFDVIFAFDVLEHIEKSRQIEFVSQIYSHLSDSGYVAFSVPNALNPCFSWMRYGDWTHQCAFTDLSLSFVLKSGGFRHFSIENNHPDTEQVRSLKRFQYDLLTIEHHFSDPILTPNLFAIAYKDKREFDRRMREVPPIKQDYSVPSPWDARVSQIECDLLVMGNRAQSTEQKCEAIGKMTQTHDEKIAVQQTVADALTARQCGQVQELNRIKYLELELLALQKRIDALTAKLEDRGLLEK